MPPSSWSHPLHGTITAMTSRHDPLRFAVIGDPIDHSLSPLIHSTSFASLGFVASYEACRVSPADLPAALASFTDRGYRGLNVTMPLKEHAVEYMDSLSDAAELMGAVNTIDMSDGRCIGHNTDGRGLWDAVSDAGVDPTSRNVIVIGAGGAGSAVVAQAALDGVPHILQVSRPGSRFGKASERAAVLAGETGAQIDVVTFDDPIFERSVRDGAIVVDCTPVGMGELVDATNVPHAWIGPGNVVVETVYHPIETRLIREAADAGALTIDGLGMLVGQAAAAEKIWLDVQMPIDRVRQMLADHASAGSH